MVTNFKVQYPRNNNSKEKYKFTMKKESCITVAVVME
jgi:hypothetical protein